MKKILTGRNLEFIATHRQEIDLYNHGIYFCFDTKENGTEAYEILTNLLASDISGTRTGWDKRDFTVYFNGGYEKAKEICTEIKKEVEEFRNANPGVVDPYYVDENGSGTGTGNGTGNGTGIGSYIYLIIGAVAIILVMLLWDNKKGK